nr:ATP-binding protein [Pseudaestuariivita rosea]
MNVLKSYTGYFDIFSELLQNALDAVDARRTSEGAEYSPQIDVEIDLQRNVVRVSDNGCGMTLDEFKFCFRPNVSFLPILLKNNVFLAQKVVC